MPLRLPDFVPPLNGYAKYQEKLKEEERQRQKEQEAERARQLELQKQQEREEEAERQLKEQQAAYKTSRNEPDELSSERGVDYTKLRDLLKGRKWQKADRETRVVMLKSINLETWDILSPVGIFRLITERLPQSGLSSLLFNELFGPGMLEKRHVKKIPCTDLRTIDQLWMRYSDGRFGFSVQKQIFDSAKRDIGVFGTRVGWRGQSGLFKGFFGWKTNLRFTLTAPPGHLPAPLKLNWVANVIQSRNLFLFMTIFVTIGFSLVAILSLSQQVSISPEDTVGIIIGAIVGIPIVASFYYLFCLIAWSRFSRVLLCLFSRIEACNL